ncbi:MAG TPA: DUF4097 family beta strand repeat-containing protein [Rhodothermales bacterium]|nr:DUF4097 family beta strand repeat-containing protein [Rhodothermales bacterium]
MIRRLILACFIAGALFVLHAHHRDWRNWSFNWHAREALAASPFDGRDEVMIDRHYSVQPGGTLEVRVGDSNLIVETGDSQDAQVTVTLSGRDMDRARRYYETLRFQVEQSGNVLRITTDDGRNGHISFGNDGGAEITVRARIPKRFNASLVTSDGNVSLGSLQGTVTVATSDGNVSAEDLSGPNVSLKSSDGNISTGSLEGTSISLVTSDGNIHVADGTGTSIVLHTSDGNIGAERLHGKVDAATSDGNIQFGQVDGAVVSLRTSDGDVTAEALSTGQADVATSDGNIHLARVDGPLRAHTASGQIDVSLLKPAEVHLRAEDGNIRISAPHALPANLLLRGEEVRVEASGMGFQGTIKPDQAEGSINGGGPTLDAYTSSGSVVLATE